MRIITGTLVQVGFNKISVEDFASYFQVEWRMFVHLHPACANLVCTTAE